MLYYSLLLRYGDLINPDITVTPGRTYRSTEFNKF